MKFKIPVTWEVSATIEVEANSIDEAIEIARDKDGLIPIPTDSDYVTDSWRVADEDVDSIIELYN